MRYLFAAALLFVSCGPLDSPNDPSDPDAGSEADAGLADDGPIDRSPGGPCDRHSTPAICRASLGPVDAG